MQKYDKVAMEMALQTKDLDTVMELIGKHTQYMLYLDTIRDSDVEKA